MAKVKMFKKSAITLVILAVLFAFSNTSYGEEAEKLTQEQFAKMLVKNMKLQGYLPTAPLPSDAVDLLDSLGISPLSGWRRKAFLINDDYMVIIAKAAGKEKVVYKNAVAVCQRNERLINQKWKDYFDKYGRWPTLSELLSDKESFPDGAPTCSFGLKYEDKNKPHAVDPHYHPVAAMLRLESTPAVK